MINNPPAIKVSNLIKTFGNQHALKKLDFEVQQGEFLTIFGPNGAGKTTLIRILSTITKSTSGITSVAGFSSKTEADKIRSQIGVIGHQTFLYDNLTAAENLYFYGRLYNVKNMPEKIEHIIEVVGLKLRRDDRVRTFSRGMQQRLSIARAMLHEPSVLLLDEPYTGLDQHASEMLSGWLKKLRVSNRTTLMVTHDIERGIDLADRIAILVSGKLVYFEPRKNIDIANFKNIYYEYVDKHNSKT